MLSPLSESVFLDQRVDFVFHSVLLVSIVSFFIGEGFWSVKKLLRRHPENVYKYHLELAWTVIPLAILILLTFADRNSSVKPSIALKKSSSAEILPTSVKIKGREQKAISNF